MTPQFIKKSDKLSLVAPSFGCSLTPYFERLNASIRALGRKGYTLDIGPNVFLNIGKASSNTPELRAQEIMDAFKGDSTALLSVGGGETMLEILPFIDFEVIKNNPKWFVGYSDNTVLTYTITTICDIESIYGVNAPQLRAPFKNDNLDTLKMLEGNTSFKGYKSFEYHTYTPLPDGEEPPVIDPLEPRHLNKRARLIINGYNGPIKGRIIGGCLDVLVCLCGTKYDRTIEYINRHKDEGIIFFMEACDLNSVSVRRALFQLKEAGWFNNIKAFLIGRSHNLYDDSFGIKITDSYLDMLKEYNVPIILDAPIGHVGPSVPIRCGASCTLSIDEENIKIEY